MSFPPRVVPPKVSKPRKLSPGVAAALDLGTEANPDTEAPPPEFPDLKPTGSYPPDVDARDVPIVRGEMPASLKEAMDIGALTEQGKDVIYERAPAQPTVPDRLTERVKAAYPVESKTPWAAGTMGAARAILPNVMDIADEIAGKQVIPALSSPPGVDTLLRKTMVEPAKGAAEEAAEAKMPESLAEALGNSALTVRKALPAPFIAAWEIGKAIPAAIPAAFGNKAALKQTEVGSEAVHGLLGTPAAGIGGVVGAFGNPASFARDPIRGMQNVAAAALPYTLAGGKIPSPVRAAQKIENPLLRYPAMAAGAVAEQALPTEFNMAALPVRAIEAGVGALAKRNPLAWKSGPQIMTEGAKAQEAASIPPLNPNATLREAWGPANEQLAGIRADPNVDLPGVYSLLNEPGGGKIGVVTPDGKVIHDMPIGPQGQTRPEWIEAMGRKYLNAYEERGVMPRLEFRLEEGPTTAKVSPATKAAAEKVASVVHSLAAELLTRQGTDPSAWAGVFKKLPDQKWWVEQFMPKTYAEQYQGFMSTRFGKPDETTSPLAYKRKGTSEYINSPERVMDVAKATTYELAQALTAVRLAEPILKHIAAQEGNPPPNARPINLNAISKENQPFVRLSLGAQKGGSTKVLADPALATQVEYLLRDPEKFGWSRWWPSAKWPDKLQRWFVSTQLFGWPAATFNNFKSNLNMLPQAMVGEGLTNLPANLVRTVKDYMGGVGKGREIAIPDAAKEVAPGVTRGQLYTAFGEEARALGTPELTSPYAKVKPPADAGAFRRGATTAFNVATAPIRAGMNKVRDVFIKGFGSDMLVKEAVAVSLLEKNPGMALQEAVDITHKHLPAYHLNPDAIRQASATYWPFLNWSYASAPLMAKAMTEYGGVYAAFRNALDAAEQVRAIQEGDDLDRLMKQYPGRMQGDEYVGHEPGKGPVFRNPLREGFSNTFFEAPAEFLLDRDPDILKRVARTADVLKHPFGTGLASVVSMMTPHPTNVKSGRPLYPPLARTDEKILGTKDYGFLRGEGVVGAVASPFVIPSGLSRAIEQLPRLLSGDRYFKPSGAEVVFPESLEGLIGPVPEVRDPGKIKAVESRRAGGAARGLVEELRSGLKAPNLNDADRERLLNRYQERSEDLRESQSNKGKPRYRYQRFAPRRE